MLWGIWTQPKSLFDRIVYLKSMRSLQFTVDVHVFIVMSLLTRTTMQKLANNAVACSWGPQVELLDKIKSRDTVPLRYKKFRKNETSAWCWHFLNYHIYTIQYLCLQLSTTIRRMILLVQFYCIISKLACKNLCQIKKNSLHYVNCKIVSVQIADVRNSHQKLQSQGLGR